MGQGTSGVSGAGMNQGGAVRRWRRWHVWLALLVGVQAAIWTVSGLYMTAISIDTIHGDHLIRPDEPTSIRLDGLGTDVRALRSHYGAITGLRLGSVAGGSFLVVDHSRGQAVLDPTTGQELSWPDEADIRRIAASFYAGSHAIARAELLRDIPDEIRGRAAPIWRVEFDHWNRPTLYLSAATGELVTRRHELWRLFDFVWMLHIMDYEARENVNNTLLRVATLAALALSLAGAGLLILRLWRGRAQGDAA